MTVPSAQGRPIPAAAPNQTTTFISKLLSRFQHDLPAERAKDLAVNMLTTIGTHPQEVLQAAFVAILQDRVYPTPPTPAEVLNSILNAYRDLGVPLSPDALGVVSRRRSDGRIEMTADGPRFKHDVWFERCGRELLKGEHANLVWQKVPEAAASDIDDGRLRTIADFEGKTPQITEIIRKWARHTWLTTLRLDGSDRLDFLHPQNGDVGIGPAGRAALERMETSPHDAERRLLDHLSKNHREPVAGPELVAIIQRYVVHANVNEILDGPTHRSTWMRTPRAAAIIASCGLARAERHYQKQVYRKKFDRDGEVIEGLNLAEFRTWEGCEAMREMMLSRPDIAAEDLDWPRRFFMLRVQGKKWDAHGFVEKTSNIALGRPLQPCDYNEWIFTAEGKKLAQKTPPAKLQDFFGSRMVGVVVEKDGLPEFDRDDFHQWSRTELAQGLAERYSFDPHMDPKVRVDPGPDLRWFYITHLSARAWRDDGWPDYPHEAALIDIPPPPRRVIVSQ